MTNRYIKDYFRFECEPIAKPEAIVQGRKYRFTILTGRLIRMEYSEPGNFEDQPSQSIWFRNQPLPKFKVSDTENDLIIETDYLILKYKKEKRFSSFSLSIKLKQMKITWFYGRPDFKNLRGTARTLDATSGVRPLEKGLMSKNGFSILDDSKSLVFYKDYWITQRENNNKDLYFFGHGRDYLTCLRDFYKVSGKTPLIPRYILGIWWSRYWEYSEIVLKNLISTFEKHEIPLSVCIIDMDWHLVQIDKKYGSGWTGYTWNKDLFPDPQRMLDWLHDKNLKISMNLHPALGIRGHEDCYKTVADFMGVNKDNEQPVKFDISDPKFVSAYFDLVHHPHEKMGVDFWWIDWQQGRKSGLEGLDPLWMLNHLHFHDLGRDGVKRPFIFSRWGRRGNHRYPIGFSGDTFATWASLKFQPYFTSTASNIGFGWWSHDIGGHMLGKDDAELYTRWVQFGVFSPILRLHSTKNEFLKREPWKYDEVTLKHTGDAMRFRRQLIPYIYSMAYRNHTQNIPLMLPLYYFEPQNPQAYRFRNEYWFGSEIVVSPIVKKMSRRADRVLHKSYLPKEQGPYFNLFTKEFCNGGVVFSRVYEISDMPVFVKAGGIIPLDKDKKSNATENPKSILIEIFPGASNEFLLYEDDGNSVGYKTGDHYITKLSLNWEDTVKFSIEQTKEMKSYIPNEREFILRFNAINQPKNIVINSDIDIPYEIEYLTYQKCLEIKVQSSNFSQIEISFSKLEISLENKTKEEAYRMLFDAKLRILRKNILKRRFFNEKEFDMERLRKLYRTISIGC